MAALVREHARLVGRLSPRTRPGCLFRPGTRPPGLVLARAAWPRPSGGGNGVGMHRRHGDRGSRCRAAQRRRSHHRPHHPSLAHLHAGRRKQSAGAENAQLTIRGESLLLATTGPECMAIDNPLGSRARGAASAVPLKRPNPAIWMALCNLGDVDRHVVSLQSAGRAADRAPQSRSGCRPHHAHEGPV